MPLRNRELDTWLGCEELGDRGPGAEQRAGKGWELLFCTGSGAAGDRAGRRLTLVALSSDDTWLGKVGVPGEEAARCGHSPLSSDQLSGLCASATGTVFSANPAVYPFIASCGAPAPDDNSECGLSTTLPEELSKEGDRVSDSSSRARSGGGKSGPRGQERLISTVGARSPDTPLWTVPVLLTLCPPTSAQRVQDLLVILRDVQP